MNKIERLIFIAIILDEAGIKAGYDEYGITEEEFERVLGMLDDYDDTIDYKKLELEGVEIIKELARSSRYSH